jgi:chromosome partitioning protein
MTTTIAFANQKGGVGKTSSAVTLACGLAAHGLTTLLVDLDPQGHVALSFGLPKSPALYRFVSLDEPLEGLTVSPRPHLSLLCGDRSTEKINRQFARLEFPDSVLADLLTGLCFDMVLLDLAPSFNLLQRNGLYASDWIVIPTRLDPLSLDGVDEVMALMRDLDTGKKCNRGYSILPTFFDRTTRDTLTQFRRLVDDHGEHVWPPIPQDSHARTALDDGQTLWDFKRTTPAMEGIKSGRHHLGGYRQVLDRLLEVIHDK